jgi:type IV pilus biogenesis/stability protein PilW
MSLIIDAIKKAQHLRLRELKGTPFFKGPDPKDEKRRWRGKDVWVFTIAGLGIFLLLFIVGSLFFLLPRSQPTQKVVSIEKKDSPVPEATKNAVEEPRHEEGPSLSPEKQFTGDISEEVLQKSKTTKKKKKKLDASAGTEMDKIQTPLSTKEEAPSPSTETEPEPKIEKKQPPPTPVPHQPIKKPSPILPKQEGLAKPMSSELEGEKSRTATSEILTYFNLGVEFYHQRDFLKAIQSYQKVIEIDPTYIEAYNNLGIVYQEIGNSNKALEMYQKAIELNPQYEKAYNNLGILFYLKGRYEESVEAFQKAIAINPNNIESLINLGTLSKRRGQVDKAIEFYQKALALNPLQGEAHYNIGLLYEQLENFELAANHYQQFIELSSKTHPSLVAKVQKRLNDLMKTRGDKRK